METTINLEQAIQYIKTQLVCDWKKRARFFQ